MSTYNLNYFGKEYRLEVVRLSIDSNAEFCERIVKQHNELAAKITKIYQTKVDRLYKKFQDNEITFAKYSVRAQKLINELNRSIDEIAKIFTSELKPQNKREVESNHSL